MAELKNRNQLEESQFCPACAAGPVGDGTYRLRRGFPFTAGCKGCDKRAKQRMEALGIKVAEEREKRILDRFFS